MKKQLWLWLLSASAVTCGAITDARAAGGSALVSQGSSSGSSDAFFGYAVAVDADTAVVGAINDNATEGAAYVYVRANSTWALQATLTEGAAGAAGDEFGYSVAVSGNTVLVGSAVTNAVYAFTRSGAVWTPQTTLMVGSPAPSQPNDCFGCAIALSGTTAIVGAPGAFGLMGAAYVFVQTGGVWQLQGSGFVGQSTGDYFGFSVALDPAADTAVVGAFGAASQAGEAYVYARSGTSWTQSQAPLTASDPHAGDAFGYSVAAGNGMVLVGAYANAVHGAVYPFAQSGSTWSPQSKLVPPDPTGNDSFGASIALSGTTAVIGAYERSGTLGPGAAYVFANSGASWAQQPSQELFAQAGGQYFGYSVAMSAGTAVVGAYGASNDSGVVDFFGPTPVPVAPALGNRSMTWMLTLLLAAAGALAGRRRREVEAT